MSMSTPSVLGLFTEDQSLFAPPRKSKDGLLLLSNCSVAAISTLASLVQFEPSWSPRYPMFLESISLASFVIHHHC
jgi:hypothetical protein